MDSYVAKALQRFSVKCPPVKPVHSPAKWTRPNYGKKLQMAEDPDKSDPLDPAGIKQLQEIIGVLLFMRAPLTQPCLFLLVILPPHRHREQRKP